MEEKLQDLLDKIYHDGVLKGQDVAALIMKDAEREAGKLLEEAKKEAAAIRQQTMEEMEELRRNVASELALSADQSINALKQKINGLITTKLVSEPLQQAFSDPDFLKKIIETVITNWHCDQNGVSGLALLLPDGEEEKLGRYFSGKAKQLLNGKLLINFDHQLTSGFRIGPADGSYLVSFTEKDFEAFFLDYLRPRTKALLYGAE